MCAVRDFSVRTSQFIQELWLKVSVEAGEFWNRQVSEYLWPAQSPHRKGFHFRTKPILIYKSALCNIIGGKLSTLCFTSK